MSTSKTLPTSVPFVGCYPGLGRGLDAPDRSFRSKAPAPPRKRILTVLFPLASDGVACEQIPGRVPIAQRIAMPWEADCERGQSQLLPNRARAFHELQRR